jgi:hypothetical protein
MQKQESIMEVQRLEIVALKEDVERLRVKYDDKKGHLYELEDGPAS